MKEQYFCQEITCTWKCANKALSGTGCSTWTWNWGVTRSLAENSIADRDLGSFNEPGPSRCKYCHWLQFGQATSKLMILVSCCCIILIKE